MYDPEESSASSISSGYARTSRPSHVVPPPSKEAEDTHYCRGLEPHRDVFLPTEKCAWCAPKPNPVYDENNQLKPSQEGLNFWSRPAADVDLTSNRGVRMAATKNFLNHCISLLNKYRPVRGGKLTTDQESTMRVINVMDDWNKHALELIEDATKYGVVSFDTGKCS
jgi:hypothetical protein